MGSPEHGGWCPLERALDLIGGRWKGLIIWHLGDAGPLRHAELRRKLTGCSQKVLTAQLRELEQAGLIRRTVHPVVPPRVEYGLLPLGVKIRPALESLRCWADRELREMPDPPRSLHMPRRRRARAAVV
jgi:DNA-binding HxlR family transcriptional regulator